MVIDRVTLALIKVGQKAKESFSLLGKFFKKQTKKVSAVFLKK